MADVQKVNMADAQKASTDEGRKARMGEGQKEIGDLRGNTAGGRKATDGDPKSLQEGSPTETSQVQR